MEESERMKNGKISKKSVEYKSSKDNIINSFKISNKPLSVSPKYKSSKRSVINHIENKGNFKKQLIKKYISLNNVGSPKKGILKAPKNENENVNENKKKIIRKRSVEFMKTKTKNFFRMYSLEDTEKVKNAFDNNNNRYSGKYLNDYSIESQLNQLENNLKITLINMKIELEKKKETNIKKDDSIKKKINKFSTSPNLIYIPKKKKAKHHKYKSIIVKNKLTLDSSNSLIVNKKIRRAHSYDFSQQRIKKIFKKIKSKLFKKIKFETLYNTKINETDSTSDYYYNENSEGFSFDPKSYYVFIFEMVLLLANFYAFYLPLKIAQNKDIGGKNDIGEQIITILIDILYIADFILSFFIGYYNHDMQLIKNNKKILINYLGEGFFVDLIEAIPLNLLIKTGVLKKNIFGVSNFKNIFLKLFAFIKPFKIFKIIKKKNYLALEEFLGKYTESYHFEEFTKFFFSFLVFCLFVHLFICLHIFLSLQNYPNWITHINIENKPFFQKYITSFYFLVTTMTTVGYGDIVCISLIERIYHIILLAIGTIIYTFVISKVGNYLRDESREQIKLSHDLHILENIRVSYPSMPFKLYFKIKSHLLNISNKRKKTGISLLINGIPDTIKIDLLFRIYAKIIKEFSIFKNVKNSNFIIQVLTSFIPITLKKEEILLLEGEMVENIIFVKDGRLSMEIIIDVKEPYKSIQHYIEVNFGDISRKDLRALNKIKSANTLLSRNNVNYKDLKVKIDNFLLDQQKKVNDNKSLIDHNGISANLGRLDFSKRQSDLNIMENYETIKIFDVRKNDNFGEVNMFLEKPSPFTLKAKSRIVEVFLLNKQEATIISKNFPNIWRKIHRKSYHNFYSLKKLTIRILKQYYNSHFYHKNKNEKPFSFNFDNSSSIISFIDKPSFLNKNSNNERLNLIKPGKNSSGKIKTVKSTQIFKNHLPFEKNEEDEKRKSSLQTLKHSYGLINDEVPSKSSNISSVKCNQSYVKPMINNISINFQSNNDDDKNINKKLLKTKTFEKFTFREDADNNDNEKRKHHSAIKSDDIGKKKYSKINNNTSIDYYKEIIQSIYNSKRDSKTLDTLLSKTHGFNDENFQDIINNISDHRIFTLKDVDEKLSKKIRKKIKMRKKIEKLKHSLELKRKENNKNLIALYSNIISQKLNLISKNILDDDISKDINNNIAEELINTTLSKYNNEHFSDLLESTTSEEDSPKKFDLFSLKKTSISFTIKSSYKNINTLSKGEIISSKKYKKFLENMVRQNTNKHFFNKQDFKRIVSKYSIKTTKHKNTGSIGRISIDKINKNNKNKRNTLVQNSKFKSALLSNINESSKKIVLNISNRIIDDDFISNNKFHSSKAIQDKMDNKNKKKELNKSNIKIESGLNEKDNNIKNKNNRQNYLNLKKDDKTLLRPKTSEKKRNSNYIKNIIINNNKSYASSINCFNEVDKDNVSKSENHLKLLNKNVPMNKSLTKDLNIDDDKKCVIF